MLVYILYWVAEFAAPTLKLHRIVTLRIHFIFRDACVNECLTDPGCAPGGPAAHD